ncbi:hypothetical protein NECAME_11614 [Necator americanus]|uniref:Uncharacterized protein n=1 Tax=Necator americanus TaxID=51031 RepID=W2T4P8_NECAM|nr:hypothetical protein NECAME_11614 [Necator americanus]ETN76554.1 hypothetical protein NECAME_11614 [Necator americanus]
MTQQKNMCNVIGPTDTLPPLNFENTRMRNEDPNRTVTAEKIYDLFLVRDFVAKCFGNTHYFFALVLMLK